MWNVPGRAVDPHQFSPLRPTKVLYDFDGPKIFTFHDREGEMYLAHWCDEDNDFTRYMVVAFSSRLLARLEKGLLSIRDALEQPRAWIVEEDGKGNVSSCWRIEVADLPEEILPSPGALLLPELERARGAASKSS